MHSLYDDAWVIEIKGWGRHDTLSRHRHLVNNGFKSTVFSFCLNLYIYISTDRCSQSEMFTEHIVLVFMSYFAIHKSCAMILMFYGTKM